MPRTPLTPDSLTDDQPVPARRMSGNRRKRLLITISVVLAGAIAATVAVVAIAVQRVNANIVRSDFSLPLVDQLPDVPDRPDEQNILIMGMDSRLDQNGNPLPDEVYQALHAGNADDGGYNANVLMLLHVPEDRSQAVGISIPRDDYVEIPGAPLGVTHTKIKEAYGLAMQERLNELYAEGELSDEDAYQEARAAGRQAQIETVSHFLGDVRIDHFVEMTMGGFYHVAEAVQPISVCLNHATEDYYSGANFAEGVQELDAEQSMSFVRQRRDTGWDGPFLTDLDRSRRQQAFMIGLADKLKQKSTLMNPKTIFKLVDVTQDHVALDTGFDVVGFVKMAHEVAQHGVRFVTLPIVDFDMIDGASVNVVDVDEVQGIVASVLDGSYFNEPEAQEDEAAEGDAGDGEEQAQGEEWAEEQPAEGADEQSSGPENSGGSPSYESWDVPIQAGSIPCVN